MRFRVLNVSCHLSVGSNALNRRQLFTLSAAASGNKYAGLIQYCWFQSSKLACFVAYLPCCTHLSLPSRTKSLNNPCVQSFATFFLHQRIILTNFAVTSKTYHSLQTPAVTLHICVYGCYSDSNV